VTFKQWASFIALTLIWGASFLWIKIAVQETGPITVVAIRLVFALLMLLPFLLRARVGFPRSVRQWGQLLTLGLISATVPWLLITWAEQYIDSAVATVLNATVPLSTVIAAHLFLHDDRMTVRKVVGLLIGFSGVVVLVSSDLQLGGDDGDSQMKLLGQGAMLISSFLYGISNVYARAKFRHTAPVYQAFYTLLICGALMWVVTPVVESPFSLPAQPITWVAIAWLGMLGAGLSYLLFYKLLHQIGPTKVATVTYTIPVVGVTLGVVFLDEALTWRLIAGTCLIVSGVWGVARKR
jgi:drug/metabolite transporter (DMT)-like permease